MFIVQSYLILKNPEGKEKMLMTYTLGLLTQIADGLSRQFGPDCEVVIHDLKKHDMEHSIVYITNGHITNRQVGDGRPRSCWKPFTTRTRLLSKTIWVI